MVQNNIIDEESFIVRIKNLNKREVFFWASLGFYILSLTQIAFYASDNSGTDKWDGIWVLAIGWMGVFDGLNKGLIWLANPLYFVSLFLYNFKNKITFIVAIFIILLALWFTQIHQINVSEGPVTNKIIKLSLGYYLWLTSFIILATGSGIEFFKMTNKNKFK